MPIIMESDKVNGNSKEKVELIRKRAKEIANDNIETKKKLPEIKIDCFKLQIRKERALKKKGYIEFDNFFNDSANFLTASATKGGFTGFFSKYISSFNGKFAINFEGRAVHLSSDSVRFMSESRIISGSVLGGTTNLGGFIKNQDDPSADAFILTDKHVEGYPFFFMIYFPEKTNLALLLVQSFSTKSITDTFKSHLRTFFSESSDGYVLDVSTLVPADIVKQFREKGVINKFVMRKQNISSDRAEKVYGMEFRDDTRVTIELKITGIKSLANAREFVSNMMNGSGTDFYALDEIKDIGFEGGYETLFEYEHNGKKSSIRSSNSFELSPSFYVAETDIVRGSDSAPTLESIFKYCISLLDSLCAQLSIEKPKWT